VREKKFDITYREVEVSNPALEMASYIHRGFREADATPLAWGLQRVPRKCALMSAQTMLQPLSGNSITPGRTAGDGITNECLEERQIVNCL
jgi:hypothetical protein